MGGRFELFALALLLVIGAYSEIVASIGPQALESTILSPRRPDVGASHRRISGVYRSRKLQIANEQAACTVQVGGTSNTFSACTALAGLSSAFRFSWTYDIASRTLHGALQGSSPTGYFALGLSDPSTPTKMAGSNAIVVQQDTAAASGASVVGYNLPDYFVQPGLVGLKLLSSKAAASATMLAATFSMVLPAMYTASALNIIYAHGDVGSDGTIQQHTFSNSLAGGAIDLTAGATTTATAATANQPSTATEATPSSPTTILPSVAIAVVSPPTPAPPTHSAAPASAASCTATIGGKSTAYSACTTLPANFNGVFKMFWSLETVASVTLMHVAFSGPSSDGYVGWGIPASAGRMIGGNAVIVYPLSAAPTGAKAADYYLGGYSTSSVTNPGKLSVVGAIDAALNSAQLITAFTLNLTTAQVANLAAFDVIYVIGSLNSDGTLGGHPKSYGMGATIDLSAAQGSAYVTAVTSGGINSQVHGAVSAVFVGLFMPLAMVFARNFKEYSPMWFHVHRIVGILAFLGTIAGVILGFQITLIGKLGTLHEVFGIAVMSLATLQVSSLLLRPTKERSLRWVWEFGHHLSGRTAIALGIANVYIGLHMKGESIIYYAIYSVLLGAILAVGFSKEVYDGIRSHRSEMSKSDSSAQIITEEERSDNLGLQMQKLRE